MKNSLHRRQFIKRSIGVTAASGAGALLPAASAAQGGARIRLALNAYSFNVPLRAGEMSLFDLVDYCSQHGFDSLDATGYYFPGYPKTPDDETIHNLKKKAFRNGLAIHGTGVRNDFSVPDRERRRNDIQMVKNWIDAAEKLGASVIRIFSGSKSPAGYTFDQVLEWMAPDIRECVEYGKQHGVMVGLQNHNDFLKTADETIKVVKAVNSDWFGVILDVGSLRQSDPYEEIEKLLPYAVSWQLKENVGYGDKEVPTDLNRVKAIIDKGGYRGFLPLETLGQGDPRVKVARFLERVRKVFAAERSA